MTTEQKPTQLPPGPYIVYEDTLLCDADGTVILCVELPSAVDDDGAVHNIDHLLIELRSLLSRLCKAANAHDELVRLLKHVLLLKARHEAMNGMLMGETATAIEEALAEPPTGKGKE